MFDKLVTSGWRCCRIATLLVLLGPQLGLAAGGFESSAAPLAEEGCLTPGGPCVLTLDKSGTEKFRSKWKETDNSGADGWDTEVFNSQAGKQLKKLGKLILHPENVKVEKLNQLISKDFQTDDLAPGNVLTVFQDKNFKVERVKASPAKKSYSLGAEALEKEIQKIIEPLQEAQDLRFKFKLFFIKKQGDEIVTTQYFAVSGATDQGALEQNATWEIVWQPATDEDPPMMKRISVVDYELVSLERRGGKLFTDVTASAMEQNSSYQQQVLPGLPQHLRSMENVQSFALFGTPGLTVGDINNDGLDDLYLCQELGLPNRLYLHKQDGTVSDVSEFSSTDWLQSSRSALLIDLDNDGDQDLAVAMYGAVVFAQNDGKGTFSIRTVIDVNDDTMSMAAADYDNDGDTDLYVTAYNPNQRLDKEVVLDLGSFVYHDSNNGPANRLLRNVIDSGRWLGTHVTKEGGLDVNNRRFSLAVSWEDYDNDGDVDLYVANDYGRDNLYRNELVPSGKPWFSDVSANADIEDSAGGMSISWGDYNRDGWMDIYLSGMWSSAGNRITFQESFKSGSARAKQRLQKFARGNALYLNQGDGTFSDVSKEAGVEMGRWAWGSKFADLNQDGWEDLFVANGFLTGDSKGGDL